MDAFFDTGPLERRLVRLEPLGVEHVPGLVEAAQEGRERYVLTGVPADEGEAREYVARMLTGREMNSVVAFATIDCCTGRVVGSTRFCNFENWRWQEKYRRRSPAIPDAVEIGGTWLARDAQRTGINREAKLLMLEVAFERWQVHRVRFRTDARNERSRAAITALGAQLDGVLRAETAGYDGAIRDSATYSMLASEWPDIRKALEASLHR
ncbi:GNAT family N-acetyltransferase [Streptomyces sp. NPDC048527]|uniref:GNAT family N-acetyltransferase n=1 Tax=Streptomyces sp. NPDC048527 TaxID=3365568 RepID=UPI00371CDD7B